MGLFKRKQGSTGDARAINIPEPSGEEIGRFSTLVEAVESASEYCSEWIFKNDSSEIFDPKSLRSMAELSDQDYLPDDGEYYVVLSDGYIGEQNEYGHIDWLFSPVMR